ncbi:MAG: hypothetical protein ABGX27_05700, partial [Desulfurobacteriaceae bacterium]
NLCLERGTVLLAYYPLECSSSVGKIGSRCKSIFNLGEIRNYRVIFEEYEKWDLKGRVNVILNASLEDLVNFYRKGKHYEIKILLKSLKFKYEDRETFFRKLEKGIRKIFENSSKGFSVTVEFLPDNRLMHKPFRKRVL